MTIYVAVRKSGLAPDGLQPVQLPYAAWREFDRQMTEQLRDIERRHASLFGVSPVLRNVAPGKPK